MRKVLLAAMPFAIAAVGCTGKTEEAPSASSPANTKAEAAVSTVAPAAPKAPEKWDGPLGVKMGLTKAELEAAGIVFTPVASAPLLYRAASAPAASGSFDDYVYYIGDEAGLCRIAAWTPVREVNQFGEQVVSAFDELQSALTEKYGKPKEYKFVQRGSIWNESRDFMMGLSKEERTHAAVWEPSQKRTLPQDVEAIALAAKAFNISSGAVKLTYEFTNVDACIKETKQKKHANL
ncbi:MAG: hypothetical protein PBV86_12440 [Delftia lacustris]|uniref:hypothetical protein n=1 Tax=Delftia TaxID=80865 RepID=UPI00259CB72A|nr:hypothetical protein [Delftia sp.]